MEATALRNFKDFLLIYNQMAELCFNRCVDSVSGCNLSADEESCVQKCAAKHININHKMMAIYMEVQPQMINKRNEEMAQQLAQQAPPVMLAVDQNESQTETSASTPSPL